MMQRRTFIHKASFGFLLFGHPGFIPGLTSEKDSLHTLIQDIISASDFKQVSILEYDPHIDKIISQEADSLFKLGYKSEASGYLISSNRKQILSIFSLPSHSKSLNFTVAMVLEKSGKTWKLVHSFDTFEMQARSKAIKDFTDHPKPAINVESIISIPKLNNYRVVKEKGKPYFVCTTNFYGNTANTKASIFINEKSIWTNEFRTDL